MTDPVGPRAPRPPTRALLLKAAVVIPDVLISTLLWLAIVAALPVTLGFALTVVGITFGALLAAGLGEDTTVRVLYRARRATPAEAPRLAVAWRIATNGLEAGGVRLRIVSHGEPVATAGRRQLLLRRDVVDAYCASNLTAQQVAALIAEGLGRLRHGYVRFDLLWAVWTVPWDFIRGLTGAIGRRLAWIPLVQFAWRVRLIVGAIAVVLEAQAGRWPSPIVIAVFIVLSYLLPCWRDAWHRHLCQAAQRGGRGPSPSGGPPLPPSRRPTRRAPRRCGPASAAGCEQQLDGHTVTITRPRLAGSLIGHLRITGCWGGSPPEVGHQVEHGPGAGAVLPLFAVGSQVRERVGEDAVVADGVPLVVRI